MIGHNISPTHRGLNNPVSSGHQIENPDDVDNNPDLIRDPST